METYKELQNASLEKMAEILSEITWGCGDCSPDNKEQCVECLKTLLDENLETIKNS